MLFANQDFLRSLFDAIPLVTLVVDDDVRLLYWNQAARQLVGGDEAMILQQRSGDVLHCIHAGETSAGCGHAQACQHCVIRNAVKIALQGERVYRKKNMMLLIDHEKKVREFPMLVTASLFPYDNTRSCILILEDISEWIKVKGLLPICAWCKKIRNDENYWQSVEQYIKTEIIDLDFTHGVCPECQARMLDPEHR
jgi:PAS domain-containing protein